MAKIDQNEIVCSSRRCRMVLRNFNEQERINKIPEIPIEIKDTLIKEPIIDGELKLEIPHETTE
jgi:hypothetical protein